MLTLMPREGHQWKSMQILQKILGFHKSGQQHLPSRHSQPCINHPNSQMSLSGFALKRKLSPQEEAELWLSSHLSQPLKPPRTLSNLNSQQKRDDFFDSRECSHLQKQLKQNETELPTHFVAVWRIPISESFASATNLPQPPLRMEEQPGMKWEHFLWKQAPAGFRAWTRAAVVRAIIKHVNSKLCCWNWLWRRSCSRVLGLERWMFCICEWGRHTVSLNRGLCSDEFREREFGLL